MELSASRRDLLLASLLTTLPLGLSGAAASPINPAQTIIKLPAELQWKANPNYPPRSSESCLLTGDTTQPGLYFTLVRWWPGYMSAPHTYTSDRFCMVMSGTWWCNSGNDFDPVSCVPASGGSFVRRVAALRRRDPQPQRVGDHRDLRHRAGQLQAGRSIEARLARRVTEADAYCCVDSAVPWPDSRLLSPSR